MQNPSPHIGLVWRCLLALNVFGFAFGHFMSDQHYRSVLWNQTLMEPIVSLFSISWDEWVTDTAYSVGIDNFRICIGAYLCILSIACVWPWRNRIRSVFIGLLFIPLTIMLFARWAQHGYDLLWPLEFCLRLSLPLFFLLTLRVQNKSASPLFTVLLFACAATFIGHGFYAIGWYPTPVTFRYMLGNFISFETATVDVLLILIGIVDVLVGLLVLWKPMRGPILIWMSIWGFLTAAMRLGFIDSYFIADTAGPAISDWLERLAHGFIPLACYLWHRQATSDTVQEPADALPPDHDRKKTVATEII